ncbi:hypothetical protein Avbf_11485 [Armadillidium vulgare]|nr:hypothetical protein Avbf_11485 [Armadillidium vulgare]
MYQIFQPKASFIRSQSVIPKNSSNSCYYDLKLNLTVRSNIMNRNVKLAMKNINQKKVIKWYVKEID